MRRAKSRRPSSNPTPTPRNSRFRPCWVSRPRLRPPISAPASAAISTLRLKALGLKSCRRWLRRGPDQLDGVVAGPFGGAGEIADLAALAVDQHRGGHPQRLAYIFK